MDERKSGKTCQECGRELTAKEKVCRECYPPFTFSTVFTPCEDIDDEIKRIRLLWVVSVTMFWVTAGLVAAIYTVLGDVYLGELMLFAGLFMVAGVYLKTKMIRLLGKKSNTSAADDQ